MKTRLPFLFFHFCALLFISAPSILAQGSSFTYQGQLSVNSAPANGRYDFLFSLHDASSAGAQQGSSLVALNTPVTNGLFTVTLDFGNVFPGANRWLNISVKTNGAASYTALSPRQQITPTPYAITAASATSVAAGAISVNMLATGAVTTDKIASAAITTDKIAAGAVKPSQIDDLGAGAYETFERAIQPISDTSPIPFTRLATIASTNGVTPILRFSIDTTVFGAVTGFSGTEEISRPYSYVIQGTASGSILDPATRIGSVGRLEFTRNGKTTSFTGLITTFEYSSVDSATRFFIARIESPLAYLALATDYKITQQKTVPEVVTAVYATASVTPPNARLTKAYSVRENVIQYGESHLDFLNRLLESEGIFYFFDHNAAAPALILGDASTAYNGASGGGIPYYGNNPTTAIPASAEYIRTFQRASHQSTLKSTVRGYNFKTPAANISANATSSSGVGEYYEFGPSPNNTVATATARARQGHSEVERNLMTGSSSAPDIRAGHNFSLNDTTPAGVGGFYVATKVRHGGFFRVVGGVNTFYYGNEFEVIPASQTFAPALSTPRPHANADTAVVTGPAGTTAFTDNYARVKVQFHWDRYGARDENSSAWIRVATPAAGGSHSVLFIPRVGDEVLVSFLQGDPDQPVVIGSLFNAQNMPPYSLPAESAKSTIRSTSTDGNSNEIRFDDTVGRQELALFAAKDLLLEAAGAIKVAAPINFNGGTTFTKFLAGQATVGTSAGGLTTVTINFSPAFSTTPRIIATPNNDPGFTVSDTFSATVKSISTSSCVINIQRVDSNGGWAQSLKLNWIAWE